MIIECPQCEAKVHARVVAELSYPPTDIVDPYKYLFLQCPSCKQPLLGYSELSLLGPAEEGWEDPTRVWPEPDEQLPGEVPRLIRVSIDDARKCFRAKVYAACAVMCGRALEAMCKEKTGQLILANGLKKLRTDNVIDDRLYQWGEALRKERNIGAHASDETISRADAQDILDFAIAIVEYVYVMSAKFEAYQQRKAKLATIKKSIKKAT